MPVHQIVGGYTMRQSENKVEERERLWALCHTEAVGQLGKKLGYQVGPGVGSLSLEIVQRKVKSPE